MKLSISKDKFKEIYQGTKVLDHVDILYNNPKDKEDFICNYLPNKLWRLNNIYTVVNKIGNLVIFVMNESQHKVYAASLRHPRIIILKSRQQGISTFWQVSFFDDCIFLKQIITAGLQAQGADEAASLLERTKLLWEELDDDIKTFLNVKVDNDNRKEFSFSNGSKIFIRTSFRSTTLQRLHISEFAKVANSDPNKAKETKTGTLQAISAGNTCIIESTGEGENMFSYMWDKAMEYAGELAPKDFSPVFLSWLDDQDCTLERLQPETTEASEYFAKIENETEYEITQKQKNFWVAQERELGKDVFQEYPATAEEAFLTDREGAFYAELYRRVIKSRGREIANLYDKNLDVQVAVDLGIRDYFMLLFFQTYTDGYRIIDEIYGNKQTIKYYCEVMKTKEANLGYNITRLILPHDAVVTSISNDTPKTREDIFHEQGYKNTLVVEKTKSVTSDIEIVKREVKDMSFDSARVPYIISCMYNYSQEYDSKRDMYTGMPVKNKYAHGADALRVMVMGGSPYKEYKPKKPKNYGGFAI